jgi:hypothetical protein
MLPRHERGQYPVGTIVRLKRTGEFAIIVDRSYLKDGKEFLNYLAKIEGRADGWWAIYDDDIELECLPPE